MTMPIDCEWYEPLTDLISDKEAATRLMNFECGLYAHALFVGDWPEIVKIRVHERSMIENYTESRLPKFTPEEIQYINGTADFFALNYYFTFLVSNLPENYINVTSWENDIRLQLYPIPNTKLAVDGQTMNPSGLKNVLKFIKDEYGSPEILLTELGVCEDGSSLEDDIRIDYFMEHYRVILEAIYEYNINVRGVAVWSLLDSFEWIFGYNFRFGIYHVDFDSPNRTRTPKKSVDFFKKITKTRLLPITYDGVDNIRKTGINRNNSQEDSQSTDTYMLVISLFLLRFLC